MSAIQKISKNLQANPNDVIYTPKPVAMSMIEACNIKPNMKVLDPSKGGGVFYDNLPKCNKDYCEITENKDFFNYKEKVDLVIGNPPYSMWDKWIEHTMTITNKFCYIWGVFNFTPKRLQNIQKKGWSITYFELTKVDWWFSSSFIVIFEKNEYIKTHIVDIKVKNERAYCEICNRRCNRGRIDKKTGKKYSMNECSNIDEDGNVIPPKQKIKTIKEEVDLTDVVINEKTKKNILIAYIEKEYNITKGLSRKNKTELLQIIENNKK